MEATSQVGKFTTAIFLDCYLCEQTAEQNMSKRELERSAYLLSCAGCNCIYGTHAIYDIQ